MALIEMGRSRGHSLPMFSVVQNLIGSFVDWNDRRRTRDTLMRLSSHELEDIGLSRADIDAMLPRHF